MKKYKSGPRFSGSTLTIVILSVLLVATVTIGITLAYFSSSVGVLGDITLGNPVNISITQGGSAVSSLTFSSDALPGTVYDQEIGVSAPANTSKALVRAKLTISNTQGATTNVEATTTSDWIKHTDNYYYYKGTLSENETISFIEQITIPRMLMQIKRLILMLLWKQFNKQTMLQMQFGQAHLPTGFLNFPLRNRTKINNKKTL